MASVRGCRNCAYLPGIARPPQAIEELDEERGRWLADQITNHRVALPGRSWSLRSSMSWRLRGYSAARGDRTYLTRMLVLALPTVGDHGGGHGAAQLGVDGRHRSAGAHMARLLSWHTGEDARSASTVGVVSPVAQGYAEECTPRVHRHGRKPARGAQSDRVNTGRAGPVASARRAGTRQPPTPAPRSQRPCARSSPRRRRRRSGAR